jgi:hypothetical protein
MSDGDDALAATAAKPSLKQRLSALFEDYGRIAIITYFTLSILTIIGFSVAIWTGVKPSSETGTIGVIIAGWVLAKATLPIRILITLGLTPVVAFVVRRSRGQEYEVDEGLPEGLPEGLTEGPNEHLIAGPVDGPPGEPPAPGARTS